MADLLRREGYLDDEEQVTTRPSRMYRLVAGIAAGVVLAGATAASVQTLSTPRAERAAPVELHGVTGPHALWPELISSSVQRGALHTPQDPRAGQGGLAAEPHSTRPAASSTPMISPGSADPSRPAGRSAPAQPAPAEPEPAAEQDPVISTVTKFFEDAAAEPEDAFALLAGPMQGSGYEEFRQAWLGVREVSVTSIERDRPGSVLVTVSLRQWNGTVLHTVQRLQVTDEEQPRITGAQLLSASRS